MKCANCGAKLEPDTLICPFCGCENTEEAREQQEETLQAIYDKIGDDNALEDEIVHKANRSAGRLAWVVIALVAVIVLLIYVLSDLRAKNAYKDQHAALDVMEQYYQEGDYEAVAEYYDKHDLYGATYGKYRNTKDAIYWMKYARERIRDADYYTYGVPSNADYTEWKESIVDSITVDMDSIFWGLYKIRKMRDAGYVYNEQEVVEYAEQLLLTDIKEVYGMQDEEIDAAVKLQAQEELDRHAYDAMAGEIADYFWQLRQQKLQELKLQEGAE